MSNTTGPRLAHDIEGISNPEADEIPRTPLSTLGLDCSPASVSRTTEKRQGEKRTRLEIVIGQHQLGIGQTRLAGHCQLIDIVGELSML